MERLQVDYNAVAGLGLVRVRLRGEAVQKGDQVITYDPDAGVQAQATVVDLVKEGRFAHVEVDWETKSPIEAARLRQQPDFSFEQLGGVEKGERVRVGPQWDPENLMISLVIPIFSVIPREEERTSSGPWRRWDTGEGLSTSTKSSSGSGKKLVAAKNRTRAQPQAF